MGSISNYGVSFEDALAGGNVYPYGVTFECDEAGEYDGDNLINTYSELGVSKEPRVSGQEWKFSGSAYRDSERSDNHMTIHYDPYDTKVNHYFKNGLRIYINNLSFTPENSYSVIKRYRLYIRNYCFGSTLHVILSPGSEDEQTITLAYAEDHILNLLETPYNVAASVQNIEIYMYLENSAYISFSVVEDFIEWKLESQTSFYGTVDWDFDLTWWDYPAVFINKISSSGVEME